MMSRAFLKGITLPDGFQVRFGMDSRGKKAQEEPPSFDGKFQGGGKKLRRSILPASHSLTVVFPVFKLSLYLQVCQGL